MIREKSYPSEPLDTTVPAAEMFCQPINSLLLSRPDAFFFTCKRKKHHLFIPYSQDLIIHMVLRKEKTLRKGMEKKGKKEKKEEEEDCQGGE